MAAPDLTGVTVLVVDDDEDTMDTLADILEHAGAVALRATSMLDALAIFDALDIRVVVTDLAMPGGSGTQLLLAVRQRRPRVPVVLVTGLLAPRARTLLDEGFSAVLYKPVRYGELAALVSHLAGM